MKQWNIRHFDRIIKLRHQGLKWDEVSDCFEEVSTQAVKQAYYRSRPKSRNQYDPISEEKKLQISKLKEEGLSYSKIAQQLSTTKSAVAGACYRWKL